MKSFCIAAIGISLFMIIFTSRPSPGRDASGPFIPHHIHWVNPDGSRGVADEGVTADRAREDRHWVNPDGVGGRTDKTELGSTLMKSSVWINPDGRRGMLGAATAGQEGPAPTAVASRD